MTFDEQLAAAMVAKLAGTTLTEVDQLTMQQASTGPATKIDPTSFLTSVKQHQNTRQQQQQQQLIDQANRAAEMAFPLPSAPIQTQVTLQTVSQPQPQTFTGEDPNQLKFDFVDEAIQKKTIKQLDLIVDYLYSINNKLETILSRDKVKHSNNK